jgi:hypothetical protein
MDLTTLKNKFSVIYGVDIDNETGMAILDQCVKKISEEYPLLVNDYVNSVADTVSYTVTKTGLIKINKVYYNNTTNSSPSVLCDYPETVFQSLSSQFTEVYEREMFNRLHPMSGIIVDYNQFELIPAPSVSGLKVYYEYDKYRTLSQIPDIFEDELFELYFYYERENEFRKNMRNNSGNQFQFDRRGNISTQSNGNEDPIKTRENEFKNVVKKIKNKAMKLGR